MKKGYELKTSQIRMYALNHGLSEYRMLQEAGLAPDLMWKARKGRRVTEKTVAKLAAVLECSPADLVKAGDGNGTDENH